MNSSLGCLALLLLVASAVALPPTLFTLSFDGPNPLTADRAGGAAEPALREGGTLVPGLRGQGFHLGRTDILAYAEPGNLNKAAGSLELWVKPDFAAADLTDGSLGHPCFFKEDAPLGPEPSNNLWLWLDGGRLRYDLRVKGGDNLLGSFPQALRGIWHHLVITWDCQSGRRLFVNGHDVSFSTSDRPWGKLPGVTWTPQEHPRFFIGNRGRDTYHTQAPLWGGCQSVVDEVAIYAQPLTAAEVEALYLAGFGKLGAAPLFLARRPAALEGETVRTVIDVLNPYLVEVQGAAEVRLVGSGRDEALITQPLRLEPGVTTTLETPPQTLSRGTYDLVFVFNGLLRDRQTLSVLPPLSLPPTLAAPREPVSRVDALEVRGGERYCESAPAARRDLAGKPYLEAGPNPFDRIAFRFDIRNPGRPHLLRLSYPDDRERIFDVIISSPSAPCSYATQGGILTGRELENTQAMQSYEMVFWPRDAQQALILTTWAANLPAALSGFEVFELGERLPPLPLTTPAAGNGRRLGLYWEDPMLSEFFGGRHAERDPDRFVTETADRLIDYLRWAGLNTLIYPVAFYQGPGCRTLAEEGVVGSGAERHPDNYLAILLRRFEEAGDFAFIPEINFCTSRTMLEPAAEFAQTPEAGYLAVSRRGEMNTGMFPRFNPLHPLYQERLYAIVADFCRQFGTSKALQALQLHLVYESPFWFGSLEWGYDGFSVSRFREETATPVPDFSGANAPAQRYEWLMAQAREPWLDWRCRRLTEFYARLARLLQDTRPDLSLILGLRYLAEGDSRLGDWEKAERSMRRVYREAGLDLERLATIPNLQLQKYAYPADLKWQRLARGAASSNAMYAGLEFRRSDELRNTLTRNGRQTVSSNLYLNYFESAFDEKKPLPGFWWKGPEWRVCALSPGGRNSLELFAESVALYDAPLITTGGFLVGTLGQDPQVQEFARAYRALPAAPFVTVPVDSDAVVLRLGAGGWLYAVSRAPFATTLTITCRNATQLTDLSTGDLLNGSALTIPLLPYQLRSFRGTLNHEDITRAACPLPAGRRAQIEQTVAQLRACPAPGADLAATLERELAAGNPIRCKHLAESVPALDLLQPAPQTPKP
jgi:hypothetical protein